MKLKSYFAGTVEAAMVLARQEMGADAMIVHSRKAMPDTRHLGEYEVVFATAMVEPAAAASIGQTGRGEKPDRRGEPPAGRELAVEIAGLKRQMERLSLRFALAGSNAQSPRLDPPAMRIYSHLLNADVSESLAEDIAAQATAFPASDVSWLDALGSRIRFDSSLGRPGNGRRIVALVGPPGCGKTTTLVKLAARYAVTGRKPAQIISADSIRMSGSDQLRAYSTILGLGFQSVDSAPSLMLALEEHRQKNLIFIDTPGLSARDMDAAESLVSMLAGHSDIDTHLVLPASMRSEDLARTVERYQVFHPSKLLFTKLDETSSPGAMINQTIRLNLPVSFVTMGQQIPEDLQPATVKIIGDVLNQTGQHELTQVSCQ